MHYKSVLESVHISRSTEQPAVIAEREYRRRLDDWSAYRTGIVLRGHEAFVIAYAGLTGKMDRIRDRTAVRLQAVKDTDRLDGHEANVLGALAQEELFGRTAHPMTRHRLMEGLGIGYRRTVSATSRLNELGLVERTGAHPIRYRLTDQARSLLHLA